MSAILEISDENQDLTLPLAPSPTTNRTLDGSAARHRTVRADTLAESVVVLLVLTSIQRLIGFVRSILVCRWLSPEELGQWDMAFGFLTLAAPLTVLGLPGSFGRYVEYFRLRGQLQTLLRRTTIACTALAAIAFALMCFASPLLSKIVFGRSNDTQLVMAMAVCLIITIAFNYLTELMTALRMARITSVVQFLNSAIFMISSVALLIVWQRQAIAMVVAYGIAYVGLAVWMAWFLRSHWHTPLESRQIESEKQDTFWPRLLSFAVWVWISNLLFNLFDVVDRYLIVHTSNAADPLSIVGAYHSSRIVPYLLVSVATLLGGIVLPHLSHDWESGHRDKVSAKLNFILKLLGLLLFTGSIAILFVAPLMFNVAFNGKYASGMAVLPWTLTFSAWFGLISMAQLYLWCAERARIGCLALLIGLIANIGINLALIPHFGLHGAVWARSAANFFTLAMIYRFNAWLGMKIDRSLLIVSVLPLALSFGPWVASVTLIIMVCAIICTNHIFSSREKRQMLEVWQGNISRLRSFGKARSIVVLNSSLVPADGTLDLLQNLEPEEFADSNQHALIQKVPSDYADSPLSRPLRVMFCNTSLHVGGAETLLFNLLQRLDRSRFAPELCCLKELGEVGEELAQNIPVHAHLLRNKFDVRILGRLTRLLREREIDAVVTVGGGDKMFWGRLAAWRSGVPVIVSALHSTGWPDGINWLNRRLTPLNDAFVAVAANHARHLVERERLPSHRVYLIPNGVDTNAFRPQPSNAILRQQLNIPASAPVVGIVAVLRPEKNHEMFLRVAAAVRRQMPEAHFLVIGDGPRRVELESLSVQLGLSEHVHFLGKRPDVPELLNLLEAFVLTSHNEANPVSILEALATAKPVVATKVGSVPETVLDKICGFLVNPGDELAMTNRVLELLLNPAKARGLGVAGRRHVIEHWSLDRMVAGYEELLLRLYFHKSRGLALQDKQFAPTKTAKPC
ncbi:MAG TPA: glycosyltransferase [Pirellulales bacterium]|jgi:O-antigen/teichoic acid export membrane protein/glycosyltransferase involved in cell wall biosynthesis|nr:glycosyltransferase [Pirellulales bacterium]